MLVVLMYHRVSHTHADLENEEHALNAFAYHLTYLSQHYPVVLPGDKLIKHRMHVCLTFDDAYFDFYHTVFPLLKKLQIPALLAIPSGLILEKASSPVETRLQVPYQEALKSYKTHESLCTWEEIREMMASSLVIPASHGLTHQPITLNNVEQEVVYAKELLKEKTGSEISTFGYPYGQMKRSVNRIVKQHHRYSMRIGSSMNSNWDNCHQVMYRINADEFWVRDKLMMRPWHKFNLALRFLSNSLRFK
ncbi:MAG: polysaccharide deacetylase family protein [Tatlockia sp.]|nr:polysaccharide deacetylase family protein [Tatlockia sp.]